jgi:hypothetical protein
MRQIAAIAIILSLVSALQQQPAIDKVEAHRSEARHHYLKPIEVHKDKGFYPFKFGQSHTLSPNEFIFQSEKVVFVTITDCFCEGDIFRIYDNGHFVLETTDGCVLSSKNAGGLKAQQKTIDPICSKYECVDYESDPATCLTDGFHCHGQAILLPGYHNITIEAKQSCDETRIGYIRVDTACIDDGQFIPCCELGVGCNNQIISESSSSSSSNYRGRRHRRH